MIDFLTDKSYANYKSMLCLLKEMNSTTEKIDYFSICLYLYQQAFEIALKSYIQQCGENYKHVHNIVTLYSHAKQCGLQYQAKSQYFLEEITDWESQSRYEYVYTPEYIDIYPYIDEFAKLYTEVITLDVMGNKRLLVTRILNDLGLDYIDVDKIVCKLPKAYMSYEATAELVKNILKNG